MKTGLLFFIFCCILTSCYSKKEKTLAFYKVSLTCDVSPEIGCGSRAKPFFIDAEKESSIKEVWLNRKGTAIAIIWNDEITKEEREKIIVSLLKKHFIEAELISDPETEKIFSESFYANLAPAKKTDKWYKGMEVDNLSFEEARIIADSATAFALRARLIDAAEAESIRKDIEAYMKAELVKVRTYRELTAIETEMKWKQYGYEMYVKHIGIDRAEKVRDYFLEYKKNLQQYNLCCGEDTVRTTSEITCPYCSHRTPELMPVNVCQIVYTCKYCKKDIRAKEGDCCVFCSYGTDKCRSRTKLKLLQPDK